MTIICFKNGIMAADGLSGRGGIISTRNAKKITRLKDGSLLGCAGDVATIQAAMRWFKVYDIQYLYGGYALKDIQDLHLEEDDFHALLARPDGAVFEIYHKGEICDRSDDGLWVVGDPWMLAHGMMLAGASAKRAVELVCANSVWCGGEIQVEHLDHLTEIDMFSDAAAMPEAPLDGQTWAERQGLA